MMVLLAAAAVAASAFAQGTPAAPPSGGGAPEAGTNVPRIEFASTTFDFGRIQQGEIVKHAFVFTNTGGAALEILEVKPGCGCTAAGAWDKRVEPGRTGSIPIQFSSAGFGGTVAKTATVICNDPVRSNLFLQITGTVWKPIDIVPAIAMFQVNAESPTNETKVLRILSNLEEPVTLSDLQCNNASFKTELKTVREGKEFELLVTAVPPFSAPTTFGNISLKTSSTQAMTLNATVYALAQPLVLVLPQQILLPPGPLTNAYTASVVLRNNGTNALRLSDPRAGAPGAEVRIQENQPGRQFTVFVTFPAGTLVGPDQKAGVTLKSDHPRAPLIKVPVLQQKAMVTAATTPPAATGPVSSRSRVVPTRVAAPVRVTPAQ
jgi:hypothetical protein